MAEKSMLEYIVELEKQLKSMNIEDLAVMLGNIDISPEDVKIFARVEKMVCGHIYGFEDEYSQSSFEIYDFAQAA